MSKKRSETEPAALKTWDAFNHSLMHGDEAHARTLLEAEQKFRQRPTFLRRAHARINKLRAMRERNEILAR